MALAILLHLCLSLKQEHDRKKQPAIERERLFSKYLAQIGVLVCSEAEAELSYNVSQCVAEAANNAKKALEDAVNIQCITYIGGTMAKFDSILEKDKIGRQDVIDLRSSLLTMQQKVSEAVSKSQSKNLEKTIEYVAKLREVQILENEKQSSRKKVIKKFSGKGDDVNVENQDQGKDGKKAA